MTNKLTQIVYTDDSGTEFLITGRIKEYDWGDVEVDVTHIADDEGNTYTLDQFTVEDSLIVESLLIESEALYEQ